MRSPEVARRRLLVLPAFLAGASAFMLAAFVAVASVAAIGLVGLVYALGEVL